MSPAPAHRPLQAVVFDLDDTLYAERDYVRSGYQAVGEVLARDTGRAEPFADWMWDRFRKGQAGRMFNVLNETFALGLTDAALSALVEHYRTHAPRIEPDPGALAVLAALRGRVKLGLLSDGFLPAQRLKLAALGLEGWFDAVVFTEELGRECWKPCRRGFELLADRLAVPHAACAYVADNPAKDFVAPNALGWLTVQWRRPGQVHTDLPAPPGGEPACVVQGPEELLPLLEGRLHG